MSEVKSSLRRSTSRTRLHKTLQGMSSATAQYQKKFVENGFRQVAFPWSDVTGLHVYEVSFPGVDDKERIAADVHWTVHWGVLSVLVRAGSIIPKLVQ